MQGLGPEPLGNEFNAAMLAPLFAGQEDALKAALLDQRMVAGLGNIYVCEALHRARISPRTRPDAREVRQAERAAEPLVGAIKEVLHEAIEAGGSTPARLRQHRRRARLFPASFPRLRPRGRALPDAGLQGHDQAERAGRPLDLLLPGVPALSAFCGRRNPCCVLCYSIYAALGGRVPPLSFYSFP